MNNLGFGTLMIYDLIWAQSELHVSSASIIFVCTYFVLLFGMFSNKKEKLQQQIKQVERDNRKSQRELERERTQLRRDEANIIAEIKKLAAQGNKESCAVLAKQLVKNRQQQARTYEMGARMNCLNSQQKMMATNIRMADSLKNTTTTMSKMNAVSCVGCLIIHEIRLCS